MLPNAAELIKAGCDNWVINETACARGSCPAITSISILHELTGGAGIGDRLYCIGTFIVFSEALCTRLLIPLPVMLIGESHNHGRKRVTKGIVNSVRNTNLF